MPLRKVSQKFVFCERIKRIGKKKRKNIPLFFCKEFQARGANYEEFFVKPEPANDTSFNDRRTIKVSSDE